MTDHRKTQLAEQSQKQTDGTGKAFAAGVLVACGMVLLSAVNPATAVKTAKELAQRMGLG